MDMPPNDDALAELARRSLAGDQNALELLCRELQGPVFRLALRVLGQPADAGDATQEILLQVVTHLSQFRGESRFLTWAYSVATRHLLRTQERTGKRRSVERLESLIRQGLSITEPGSAPEGDARVLERETRLGCTSAMLSVLSVEERIAIVLAEMLGADDALGAELCGVEADTYRKRLSRARMKLRPILEELCGLATAGGPCSCQRQARAKEIVGISTRTYVDLPVVDEHHLRRASEELGALHGMGPVFAVEPPVGPPAEVWAQLQRRLTTTLGTVDP